jgi:uncharacterized membrane protein YecN with MAPEG domain
MPHLVPATALWAGLLAVIYVIIGMRIPPLRRRHRVSLSDGGHPDLATAVRVHGNFAENTPLALVLMALLELNGLPAWAIHGLGVTLTAGRLLNWRGLRANAATPARTIAMVLTWMVFLAAGLLAAMQGGGLL